MSSRYSGPHLLLPRTFYPFLITSVSLLVEVTLLVGVASYSDISFSAGYLEGRVAKHYNIRSHSVSTDSEGGCSIGGGNCR